MKLRVIGGICLLLTILIIGCEDEQSIDFKRYYAEGSVVYQTHCQNCHGEKGQGLAALIPPLTDTAAFKANGKLSLPCIIQNGLQEKITVAGKQFEGNMPPVGLTPIEVAQAVIYVSNSFGNKNGFKSADKVNSALNNCR
jgi:mono/diheme cytochrome c family protein